MSVPPAAMPKLPVATRLPQRTVWGYALGSVGTGGFATLPGLALLPYLTDVLAVPSAAAGLIVTIPKIWDVALGPLIGHVSDQDRRRTGSRRRVMLLGALGIPLFFATTFAAPAQLSTLASGLWVLIAFLLSATAFVIFQVPYLALPAELTGDYDERTRLLGWRVAVLAVAIMVFGAGGPLIRGDTASRGGTVLMGIIAAVVISGGMVIAAQAAPKLSPRGLKEPTTWLTAMRQSWDVVSSNAQFRVLLMAFFLQALATGSMLAAANYVANHVLHSDGAVTILFIALIAPAMVAMPLWTKIARRSTKQHALFLCSALFALATTSLIPMAWVPGPWVYGSTVVAGLAYAGMQALPLAMLPDVMEADGSTRSGIFSGVWTAGETTGMALGATVTALILQASGYLSGGGTQPESAVTGIAMAFSAVPAALTLISMAFIRRYALSRPLES